MYQPYPGGNQNPYSRRPPAPPSVQTAVKFMYAGAVLSLVSIAISLATVSSTKRVFEQGSSPLTPSQINDFVAAIVGLLIVIGLIGAGLWLFVARFCLRGKNWARITGTVLFALSTLDNLGSLGFSRFSPAYLYGLLGWLVGLCAVIYLWRPDSTAFFKWTPA
jgi:hypothetical protein